MLTVGLTGGYATGKSFVAAELERLGCRVIRADELGRRAIAPDGPAYAAVVGQFGAGILGPDGEIDRKRLAAIVFPDPAQLARLNALIHPHVFRWEQEEIAAIGRDDPSAIVVVEAAIMVEVGSWRRYDVLLVAMCPEPLQIARARARDRANEAEVRARIARQAPLEEKAALADYVIDTSGTPEQTLMRTRSVFEALRKRNLTGIPSQ